MKSDKNEAMWLGGSDTANRGYVNMLKRLRERQSSAQHSSERHDDGNG